MLDVETLQLSRTFVIMPRSILVCAHVFVYYHSDSYEVLREIVLVMVTIFNKSHSGILCPVHGTSIILTYYCMVEARYLHLTHKASSVATHIILASFVYCHILCIAT